MAANHPRRRNAILRVDVDLLRAQARAVDRLIGGTDDDELLDGLSSLLCAMICRLEDHESVDIGDHTVY